MNVEYLIMTKDYVVASFRAYRGPADAKIMAKLMQCDFTENDDHRPFSVLYQGIENKANGRNALILDKHGYIRLFAEGKYCFLRFDLEKSKRTKDNIKLFLQQIQHISCRSNKNIRAVLLGDSGWKHRLLQALDFTQVRYFFEMERTKKVISWDDKGLQRHGLRLEGFTPDLDIKQFNRCYNKVFANDFEHTPTSCADWKGDIKNGEITKDTLFLIKERRDDIVGFLILSHYLHRQGSRRFGFIEDLGIKRQYRGKGLGTVLLQYGVKKLQETHHVRPVRLHVDTENESNALQLYRKNGFEPVRKTIEYQYPLSKK